MCAVAVVLTRGKFFCSMVVIKKLRFSADSIKKKTLLFIHFEHFKNFVRPLKIILHVLSLLALKIFFWRGVLHGRFLLFHCNY